MIKTLLEYQASVFAVDVGNYSILSNHQHLIARTRPDIAATRSDEQVAWRWKLAWPTWIDGQWIREPTDQEIEEVLSQRDRIAKLRANLASLSCFMARWKEPIAKLANGESGTTGHYYEQRFGSRELVDDAGNLCGNVYLDVNQLKAGVARSLDESTCSPIYDRIQAWRQREIQKSVEKFQATAREGYVLGTADMEPLLADCFLSPIDDRGPLLLVDAWGACRTPPPTAGETIVIPVESSSPSESSTPAQESPENDFSATAPPAESSQEQPLVRSSGETPDTATRKSPDRSTPTRKIHHHLQRLRRRRASDHPFLGISREQYLQIVQLTAERLGSQRSEPPPAQLDTLLRR